MTSRRMPPLAMGIAACALLAGTQVEGVVPSGQSTAAGGVGPGTFAQTSLTLIALMSAVAVVRGGGMRSPDPTSGDPAGTVVRDGLRVVAIIASSVLFGRLIIDVSVVLGVAMLCVTWLVIAGERRWLPIATMVIASSVAASALVLVTGAQVERLIF